MQGNCGNEVLSQDVEAPDILSGQWESLELLGLSTGGWKKRVPAVGNALV